MKTKSLILSILIAPVFSIALAAQEHQRAELYVQTGHTGQVNALAFSPDGRLLASGSGDATIKLWDVATGQELSTFPGSNRFASISSIAFSPDGRILASSELLSNIITLWDLGTGQHWKVLSGHGSSVDSILYSPDGRMLASHGVDTITLWDIPSGREIRRFADTFPSAMAFSPDGKLFAFGSGYINITLWDTVFDQALKVFPGNAGKIFALAFSPDGRILSSGSWPNTVKLWDANSGKELRTLFSLGEGSPNSPPYSLVFLARLAFTPNGKYLATKAYRQPVKWWDIVTGQEVRPYSAREFMGALVISPSGTTLATWDAEDITLWDLASGQALKSLKAHAVPMRSFVFSSDERTLAFLGGSQEQVVLWDITSGRDLRTCSGHTDRITVLAFSPDGRILASGSADHTIKLWDVATGQELRTLVGHALPVYSVSFSPDGRLIASGSADRTARLWDVSSGQEVRTLSGHTGWIHSLAFSPDGRILASGSQDKSIKLWDVRSGKGLATLIGHSFGVGSLAFSPDGTTLASKNMPTAPTLPGEATPSLTIEESSRSEITIKLWDAKNGRELKSFTGFDSTTIRDLLPLVPDLFEAFEIDSLDRILCHGKYRLTAANNNSWNVYEVKTGRLLVSIVGFDENEWVVTTPEGRFDTNRSLDRTEGLHWVVNREILKPLSLDVFMRQYYEPGLFQRVLKCNAENNCDKEFTPLPSIAEVNRVQPKVGIKNIRPATKASDLVDVTVEVQSITEDVGISATDRTKKKRLSSGAFDLRLFRDGQLVGVSAPRDRLVRFINDAPQLVAETKASGRLVDTPEDRAWREANDIFKLKAENVKLLSADKVQYTFHSIKLPRDGRKGVEFTAYAFNADRVKSTTTEPFKFTIPAAIAEAPKKGRAFVISIGINASETPAYHLRYAANDARKMQEIIGARLRADAARYSEVIQIPLISDYGPDKKLAENTAQKAIIKGVFSLLAGNEREIPPDILKQIPNRDKIKAVEPEDTLIITYAGHGYADQAGIFYLLPYDIGKDTRQLTTDALRKTISSDELSLWMQDITAAEMIMIIDACHSSAAVQGDGFKPGPMGSRGLGQLAYDKDMKILSATQADNVALELNSLEQGLLSYALLQDGIINSLADSDKNKQLFAAEWLGFAEKRVPELYQEVKDGRRGIFINGRNVKAGDRSSEAVASENNKKSSVNLQQPSLFDFKRLSTPKALFSLP